MKRKLKKNREKIVCEVMRIIKETLVIMRKTTGGEEIFINDNIEK